MSAESTELRDTIAVAAGIPAELTPLLTADTRESLEAQVALIRANGLVRPDPVRLAGEALAIARMQAADAAAVQALFGPNRPAEPEADPSAPQFDGGARTTAPAPVNALEAANRAIGELLAGGRGEPPEVW